MKIKKIKKMTKKERMQDSLLKWRRELIIQEVKQAKGDK